MGSQRVNELTNGVAELLGLAGLCLKKAGSFRFPALKGRRTPPSVSGRCFDWIWETETLRNWPRIMKQIWMGCD